MAPEAVRVLAEPAVRDFVVLARVAHLATAGADGAPHNVPLCFWFDGDRFYFVVDEKPKRRTGNAIKRMRNIAANPRVVLLVDHYEEDWAHLGFVMVHGHANVVEARDEYLLALRGLRDKYPQYRSMALSDDRNPIVRIEPDRVHAWGGRFQKPAASADS